MKPCSFCKIEKELFEFSKSKANKDGLQYMCNSCHKQIKAKYYLDNKDKIKQRNAKWYIDNREHVKQKHAKWYIDNREHVKQQVTQWNATNPGHRKQYTSQLRQTNPLFKLSDSIRSLIYSSFKRSLNESYKKGKKTEQILGCTIEEFIHIYNSNSNRV